MVIWGLLNGLLLLTTFVFMNVRFFQSADFRKQTGDRKTSQFWAVEAHLWLKTALLCRDVDYYGACPNRCH